jgi:DNA-directed RNA polymerase specialized sigma24 family protein
LSTQRAKRTADSIHEPAPTLDREESIEEVSEERPRLADESRPRASRPNWRAILSGASPREVLARTMAGDPLRLRARVAAALERECVVLDADRVVLRAAARIARFAPRYRGQPELEAWLDRQASDAVRDMLEQDADDAGTPRADTSGLRELAAPLGLDERAVHTACAHFNALAPDERRAFRALVLENRSLDELARESGSPATEIARAARRALETLLVAVEGDRK